MSRLLVSNGTFQRLATCPTGRREELQRRWKSLLNGGQRQWHRQIAPSSSQIKLKASDAAAARPSVSEFSTSPSIVICREFSSSAGPKIKSNMPDSKFLDMENINPNFVKMEYAVRGPLVIRAGEIERELKQGAKKPFNRVIRANIGDSHAMGQPPITFVRQMLALTFDPSLLDSDAFPQDAKDRVVEILRSCSGCSIGSYTESAGIEVIRHQVAKYIADRDGFPSKPEDIYLSAGATPAIKSVLALLNAKIDGKTPGVMVPTPQYPLYSATIAEYGMEKVGYYLDEDNNWGLSPKELERSYAEAKQNNLNPRAIVVINPGNPTGQVLTRENIVSIIKFAYEKKLLILADEVYQHNIWDKNSKFYSFKMVANDLGGPYKDMEMASFMSASKGFLGECGIRGGYMEVVNFDPQVRATLAKSLTASLCPTTAGQVAVSALVNAPQKGEPSHDLFVKEREATLESLKKRANLIYSTFNKFNGFKVNLVQGAMYIFPKIDIPKKALEAAKAKNMPADTFYAFELLESTGICIVPGSGFGQIPGTYHFRTTILPQIEELEIMLQKFNEFHTAFMKKYN